VEEVLNCKVDTTHFLLIGERGRWKRC